VTQPIRKPKLFIGSSREAMPYGQAVHSVLSREAQVLPWYDGTFSGNEYTMESLEKRLDQSDFAVFIFSPDDVGIIRGKPVFITRDNTIFEMGLFWGRLRRLRVFCLIPQDIEVSEDEHIKGIKIDQYHLLSDLNGLTLLQYEYAHDDEYEAAVSVACATIKKAIQNESFFEDSEEKYIRKLSLVRFFWEYNQRVPVTKDVSIDAKYRALVEAIRISFMPPQVWNCHVTHVALYVKHGIEGFAYVAGNMDEGAFHPFSVESGNVTNVVIEVHQTQQWKFTHSEHVEKVSMLCYPLNEDYVVSIRLSSDRILPIRTLKEIVDFNGELFTCIKQLVGGDSK